MGADPTAYPRERNGAADQIQRFAKTLLGNKGHVALDVDAARAAVGAGGLAQLVYYRAARLNTLGQMDGLAVGAGHGDGADLDAIVAGGALGQVHVAGMLPKLHMKASRTLRGPVDRGVGPDLDIGVLGQFQQARIQQVLGYGGLPVGAKERRGLDQVYLDARACQVQGCLNAGKGTADDECAFAHENIPRSRIGRASSGLLSPG